MTLHIVDSLPRHVRKPNLLPRILDAYASTYELGLGKIHRCAPQFSLKFPAKDERDYRIDPQISLPATTSYSPKLVSIRSMKTTATKSIASGLKAIGGWFHNLADQISSMSDAELASLEDGKKIDKNVETNQQFKKLLISEASTACALCDYQSCVTNWEKLGFRTNHTNSLAWGESFVAASVRMDGLTVEIWTSNTE